MAGNAQILEGFLCPVCMTDLKAPDNLTKHFEEFHNNEQFLKSLKDLLGKAKKKILKQDEMPEVFSCTPNNQKHNIEISTEQQEAGVIKSHTRYFKEVRNMRLERYTSETNKLLIRLDKLLDNLPLDPSKRKVHEQSIVPWIDETDVKLCPTCAKSFHVARRKHHCRLCGAIMCHNCTLYLSLLDARKMTSPVSIQDDSAVSPTSSEKGFSERVVRAGIGLTKLARSPSSGSLNSVLALVNDSTGAEQHFKVCTHCMNLLDAREKQKEKQFHKPIVCQFYEKMKLYMEETMQILAMYNKMSESLREGESTYDLQDAQTLRLKIAKLGENIDAISKRILVLGTRDVDNSPQGQELRLHQMVRASAMIFLKEQLLSIQSLPSIEEYATLKEERQRRIELKAAYEQRLEEQRQKSREQNKRDTRNLEGVVGPLVKENQQQMTMDQSQGWGPSIKAPMISSSTNPLIEQMNNLTAYIEQARADCKFDEVTTLEDNLKELRSAYYASKESNNSE
ncbi:rabenosyn-5 [Polistes fuscatus]|uniref:rabenosyn-5 n=1 Tax=Polistes fuscatus TaxID=30207 RepID=UPI001CA85292|nr:rabenosyn-5 [Polistes fuscatus]